VQEERHRVNIETYLFCYRWVQARDDPVTGRETVFAHESINNDKSERVRFIDSKMYVEQRCGHTAYVTVS